MTPRIIALTATLIAFAALTSWPLMVHGYFGFFPAAMANPASIQVLADLVIACSLIMLWMVRDARSRGLNPWPFVVLTLLLGSFGPLTYLLWREIKAGALTPAEAR